MSDPEEPQKPKPVEAAVLIGLPIYSGAEPAFLYALIDLTTNFIMRGIPFGILMLQDSLITRARNRIANEFLQDRKRAEQEGRPIWTHLLFLDADLVFKPEDVLKLIASDKEIIGGSYPAKSLDWRAIIEAAKAGKSERDVRLAGVRYIINYMPSNITPMEGGGGFNVRMETELGGVVAEVLEVGTGMLSIKASALEKLAERAAVYKDDFPGPNFGKEGYDFFGTFIDKDTRRFLSEDYAFCRRWQMVGGKCYMLMCKVSHVGKFVYEGDIDALCTTEAPCPPDASPNTTPEK